LVGTRWSSELAGELTASGTYELDGGRPRPPPVRVGRYQLGEQLGSGAMGVVYRAQDPELDRAVAIKVVRASSHDASFELRLLREAQAMARLKHRNVVPIFDVGPAGGGVFLTMPLLEGGTLRRWLSSADHTTDAILDRFVAAGSGLAAAHDAGLVHRDFKPDNVLIDTSGETLVADFGLACLAHDEIPASISALRLEAGAITQTGAVLGTPAYMAPEQLRGQPSDARADQFSFCVAVWEAVYGVRPFAAPPKGDPDPIRARLDAIAAGPMLPVRHRPRPAWIAPLLIRGLDPDPARRWPTMQALLDAIARRRAPRRWPKRLALGLCPAVVVLALAAWPRSAPPSPAVYRMVQLTHRGDLSNAALSPDGSQLAIVAGDSLILRGVAPDAEDRVLVEHGIADLSISWSPDGHRLLATTTPALTGLFRSELIDVERGPLYTLPVTGFATFLSSDQVAVIAPRQHEVEIYALGERATRIDTCNVPAGYVLVASIAGMPDGTIILEISTGEQPELVFLRRLASGCELRATFGGERFATVALTDTGHVVTLVPGQGLARILELSLDGELVARREVNGDVRAVLGHRHGADFVISASLKTHLVQVHGMEPPELKFSVDGSASFSLSPDGTTLAWIEHVDAWVRRRGPLRLSTLANLDRRGYPLIADAVASSWSPAGDRLAVLVDKDKDEGGIAVWVIDRDGGSRRRLPLRQLDSAAIPVWLDDHRVAARVDDRNLYVWYDLDTGEQGQIGSREHGGTYWMTRSPRDGTLAMWRVGPPGAITLDTEHLWLMSPGQLPRPLHVELAATHHLLPSWSRSGELLVRVLDSGLVAGVDLETGELTTIARLPGMLLNSSLNHEHLLALPDGALLAVNLEPNMNISVVDSNEAPPSGQAERPPPR
ncbi:MAG TPA: protein kinase, partial [Kofleriaceae bacterium]|nr:protein kinase [Kofleriaceae bacterium]